MTMQSQDKAKKYHRTLNKLEAKLSATDETQKELLTSFRSRMSQYGVDVSDDQAEVLLSRIDAGDITRMALVFAVLSTMTAQFADARREGGENIDVAKKYYAIYLGLLCPLPLI